jgi:probable F420-dependent oxidoreductase
MSVAVRLDAPLVATGLAAVPGAARRIEADGFDGAYTFEGPRDPFLPLVLAAEHTERIELMTAVAIAFARNPMTVASLGWDLQAASGGRVVLGLGSQIRPHVERRFSMPWSAPADRMRDFASALRAIWACWQDGAPLRFEGTYYRHTLMTPFFSPAPLPCGPPRLLLAGVGPAMTAVAGDVADGFVVHPFATPDHLRAVTLPALRAGARGRDPTFEVAWPVMIATGATDADRAGAELATRAQIAFYASTPAYRSVLSHHGLDDLQPRLRDLTRAGDWERMIEPIDDELFDLVAIRGTPAECGRELAARTVGLVDRVGPNAPDTSDPGVWVEVLKAFRTEVDRLAGMHATATGPDRRS